jgi:hypothetical protein
MALYSLLTIRSIELFTLILDLVGLVFTSIPLWTFAKPIKLTPYNGDGVHFGHSEIESVINKMIDNFGLIIWMRIGLIILGISIALKFFIWTQK